MSKAKSELENIAAASRLVMVVLIVAALYFARDVFIPLALGILLSFLLSPIVDRLQRQGMASWMAVLLTAVLIFVVLAGGFTLVGRELSTLVGDLPKHKGELVSKARSLAGLTTGMGGGLDELAGEVAQAMEDETTEEPEGETSAFQRWTNELFPESKPVVKKTTNDGSSSKSPLYVQPIDKQGPLATWASTAGSVLGPLTTAGLVTVFALFMLIHREDLRDRIIAVVSHGNYVTTTDALDEAAQRISRYLVAQSTLNAGYGIVMTIGLSLIGLLMTPEGVFPNAILWGVLAACLRFVPYVGPVLSAVFPLGIALSVFPGYGVVIAVLALIVVMELLSNNVLEPWLYGASTGISAVAVIIAAVFWGWLWGPVGLLLSTPLTVCLVVLGRYVPRFKIFTMLLGEEVSIKPSLRFYQRLLAGDYDRAREMLLQYADDHDLDATSDRVIIPALRRIRTDVDAERLTENDANRLFSLVGGLIGELDCWYQQPNQEEQAKAQEQARQAAASEREPTSEDLDQKASEEEQCSTLISEADSVAKLPLVVGCSTHHLSESLVLNLLRVGGRRSYRLTSIDDDAIPDNIAKQVVADNPLIVVIVVMPKGGFAQARFLCQAIRSAGYGGVIVVCCLGKFKNFDRLFVKFRRAGATLMTTTYGQTHKKLESIVSRSEGTAPQPAAPDSKFVEV